MPSLGLSKIFHRKGKEKAPPPEDDPAPETAEETSSDSGSEDASATPAPAAPAQVSSADSAAYAAIAHWSAYGIFNDRPDDPKAPRATATDWSTNKFSKPQSVAWDVPVHKDDVRRLVLGFVPQAMEEKWFVYSEDVAVQDAEGRTLPGLRVHFFRSWTGTKIVELEVVFSLELDADGVPERTRVTKLTYETRKKIVGTVDVDHFKETAREVCSWVLRVRLGQEGAETVEDANE